MLLISLCFNKQYLVGKELGKSKREHKRSLVIHLDPRNIYEFEALQFDLEAQKLMGLKDGVAHPLLGKSKLEYRRTRSNKEPKVLHASGSPTGDVWFSANHQLLSYDHLIAVDTNTYQLGGSKVSITAAYHVIPGKKNKKGAQLFIAALALVEFWNVSNKPENFGWLQVLLALYEEPERFDGNIGLIVDSDLGNHSAFNCRELPIFDEFYLPENVSLIHATDSGAPEILASNLIRRCHKLAENLYKRENLLLRVDGLYRYEKSYCTHFRQWDMDSSDLQPSC